MNSQNDTEDPHPCDVVWNGYSSGILDENDEAEMVKAGVAVLNARGFDASVAPDGGIVVAGERFTLCTRVTHGDRGGGKYYACSVQLARRVY